MLTSTDIRLISVTAIASSMFLTVACSTRHSTSTAVIPTPSAATPLAPQLRTTTATSPTISTVEPFSSAEDKAISAAKLAQDASTIEDWDLVKSRLQQAIALMKTVPASSPKRAIAQKRQALYQQQIKVAQQQSQKLAKGNTPTLRSATTSKPTEAMAGTAGVPVILGRGLTSENYSRIEFGMSPDAV